MAVRVWRGSVDPDRAAVGQPERGLGAPLLDAEQRALFRRRQIEPEPGKEWPKGLRCQLMKSCSLTVLLLAGLLAVSLRSQAKTRSINIDAQAVQGPLNTFFRTSVGAGRANEGL